MSELGGSLGLHLGCACVLVGLSGLLYALVTAPLLARVALGVRGARRQESLRQRLGWRAVEPAVRWLAARLEPLLRGDRRAQLEQRLLRAGDPLGLSPEEFVAVWGLTIVLCGLCGWAAAETLGGGALSGWAGLLVGAVLPELQLTTLIQERERAAARHLPAAIDLLVLTLSAGLDFPAAVREVVNTSPQPNEPLVEGFRLVLWDLDLGHTRSQALETLARRLQSQAVREFVAAVAQAEQQGSPLAQVLATQARVSRQKRSVRAEELAARAGTQLTLPMMMSLVCAGLLLIGPMVMNLKSLF